MIIQDAHAVVGPDWQGISVLIGVIITGIVTLGNAAQNWRAARKAAEKLESNKQEAIVARVKSTEELKEGQKEIHALVNDRSDQQDRTIDTLKKVITEMGGVIPENAKRDRPAQKDV